VLMSSIADDVIAAIDDNFVAVSVRLDPQRWAGPFNVTGAAVDLYDNQEASTGLLVEGARIIEAPDTTELDPRSEAVITLAVPADDVSAVIDAAANGRLWAVGS
jgi:3-hydroxyisobutyrate dehydrogenase-like beta-hydroxyacid dehydrogenase